MEKIIDSLFVGTVEDIPFANSLNYSILGCCKEPLHRKHAILKGASEEGYVGRAMDKREPEYLWAERDHALYLNLIDAREAKYIPDKCINKALDFIEKEIADGRNVLICCNKGESRSPSIVLMFLIKNNEWSYHETFENVIHNFSCWYYENYNPNNGMKEYVKNFWEEYYNGKY